MVTPTAGVMGRKLTRKTAYSPSPPLFDVVPREPVTALSAHPAYGASWRMASQDEGNCIRDSSVLQNRPMATAFGHDIGYQKTHYTSPSGFAPRFPSSGGVILPHKYAGTAPGRETWGFLGGGEARRTLLGGNEGGFRVP